MKSAVVTGATSMLGIATINELISHDIVVYALVHKGSKKISKLPESDLIHVVECDNSEMKDYDPKGFKADVFYHFAWGSTDKSVRDDPAAQLQNLNCTLDAVNLAHRFCCSKFIGAGSQAEYGICKEVITEETPVNPVTCYGVTKFAAGKLAQKQCEKLGMVCIWTRIFSVFGEGEALNTMLSYSIKCALEGEKASFSAATNEWDYLYKSDLAQCFFLLGKQNCASGVYNIASGRSRLLREFIIELAEIISQETGKKLEFQFAAEPVGENTPNLRVVISKVSNATDFIPRVTFADGARKLISSLAEERK